MAEDAIHAFLHDPTSIPEQFACDCVHSERNRSALSTAARVGKALLSRHEAYIADSERDRKVLMARIETLESEKQLLEKRNATAIEENRGMLDQLEALNNAVADSDAHVARLQSTLQSSQHELTRFSTLTARTARLEQQIADFEREQATWQEALSEKEEHAKKALRRWQDAERTLTGVQDELDRIELEAKEERERHVEVLGRMERRHAVERELNSAAGRLKGAAALRASGADGNGTNVVSHFVKDILQDNANLQMGIVELRDMLQNSNEEVEQLRSRLSIHEPDGDEPESLEATINRPHLKEEMRSATAQELHVHHHYHAPAQGAKSSTIRRPKKKRYGALTAGHITPLSGTSTPRSSISYQSHSTGAAILQQTAASLPDIAPINQRWSTQSNHTYRSIQASSGPGSPHSTNRTSSYFDRVFSDSGQDSSRPTTPETEEPGSPLFRPSKPLPSHSKRASRVSQRSRSATSGHKIRPSLDSILDISIEDLQQSEQQGAATAILEEEELDWDISSSTPQEEDSNDFASFTEELAQTQVFQPRLIRRATSHESLFSVSGMDIHTLKSRPSQLMMPQGGRAFTTQAVLSGAVATATRPTAMSQSTNSGRSILTGMSAEQRQPKGNKSGLGKKVGGWMFGSWGSTPEPTATTTNAAPVKIQRTLSVASGSTGTSAEGSQTSQPPKIRTPGINQTGPIPGFGPEIKRQHAPIVRSLDPEALTSLLAHQ